MHDSVLTPWSFRRTIVLSFSRRQKIKQVGFLEDENEAEWMAGADVDPEAEKIFFGDKVPFADLGESCWNSAPVLQG